MAINSTGEVKKLVLSAQKPVKFSFQDLRYAFGFQRLSGEELAIIKLVRPSFTEERSSYPLDIEIKFKIETWCAAQGIAYQWEDHGLTIIMQVKSDLLQAP